MTSPGDNTVTYTYDDAGRRSQMTNPDGGSTTYSYDAAGRLIALTNNDSDETTFAYDAVGNRSGITRANGTYTSYTYTDRNWLEAMENIKSDDTVISSFVYDHDDAGNRTKMTENNGDYTTYAYDDIYQLTGQTKRNSADTIQFQYTYAYDDVGNRLTETDADGDITTYSYNVANELTHTVADGSRVTYTYDSNGNMTATEDSGGTTAFDYSPENRMEVVTYPDSTKTTFAYNAAGKRVSKEDSSGTVKYLYDRDKVVLERDGGDNTVARYTHEGGSLYEDLISMKRAGSSYQYLYDGLGSVSEVVDSSEATQNSYRYEAFGQIESSTSSVSNPYAYVGAYGVDRDPGPSLYFMQARYYKAGIGRFVSEDPMFGGLRDPLSLHRYLYVDNNAAIFTDAGGEGPISCGILIVGCAAIVTAWFVACAWFCARESPCTLWPTIERGPCGELTIDFKGPCWERWHGCFGDCLPESDRLALEEMDKAAKCAYAIFLGCTLPFLP